MTRRACESRCTLLRHIRRTRTQRGNRRRRAARYPERTDRHLVPRGVDHARLDHHLQQGALQTGRHRRGRIPHLRVPGDRPRPPGQRGTPKRHADENPARVLQGNGRAPVSGDMARHRARGHAAPVIAASLRQSSFRIVHPDVRGIDGFGEAELQLIEGGFASERRGIYSQGEAFDRLVLLEVRREVSVEVVEGDDRVFSVRNILQDDVLRTLCNVEHARAYEVSFADGVVCVERVHELASKGLVKSGYLHLEVS